MSMVEETDLISALRAVEAEALWSDVDVGSEDGPRDVFSRHLSRLLETIRNFCPDVDSAYGAITGLTLDVYSPVAAVGRSLESVIPSRQHSPDSLVADLLANDGESAPAISNVSAPRSHPLYKGPLDTQSIIVVRLIGNGELFGYICLNTNTAVGFSEETKRLAQASQPVLSRALAESVFSLRLWEMSKALRTSVRSLDAAYENIVDGAARVFGATGAILRIRDVQGGRLAAAELAVAKGADAVAQELLAEGSVEEAVAQEVFDDERFGWTVGALTNEGTLRLAGAHVNPVNEGNLGASGLRAYAVFRLQASTMVAGSDGRVGTLSIFHCHNNRFSWRDIALARSYAQQASNIIGLVTGNILLSKANEELSEAHSILLAESKMGTRTEVVALLAHDLGHKALGVVNAIESLREATKKAIRESRPFTAVQGPTDSALTASKHMTTSLQNINNLFGRDSEAIRSAFDVRTVVDEVFSTLSDALDRNKCEADNSVPPGINVFGDRSVLLQTLFNLVINSIEAQRARPHPRRNTIHVTATNETAGRGVTIKLWDEGPGIDRNRFPNANTIFELGQTSKPTGTGRGLTISRSLISSSFGGSILLVDSSTALFHIVLPSRN